MSIDFSILQRFKFEYAPVGVKFSLLRPRELPKLDRKIAFCAMLKEGQTHAFYSTFDNHECKAGPFLLGMCEEDPVFESGQVGPKLGVYSDPRANRRLYLELPRLAKGSAEFTLYAPLSQIDQLGGDPDLLVVMCTPSQAEIILRAKSYRNGRPWNAKGTPVFGCAYLYMYPYVSGELNLMITGLHHGMKCRHIFPEGYLLLSIPFDIIPEILQNLREMEWDLPQYHGTAEEHRERMSKIASDLHKELDYSFTQEMK